MNEREALLRAVCENPDDDTPRLVFADWLQENGDEARAEFIRVQVEIPMCQPGARRLYLTRREHDLLNEHEQKWYWPLVPFLFEWSDYPWAFRRGFVDVMELRETTLIERGNDLFRLTPLTHARLPQVTNWKGLADCRHLARLRAIDFEGSDLDSTSGISALFTSPYLLHIRELFLDRIEFARDLELNDLGELSVSAEFNSLRVLSLNDNRIGPEVIPLLAAAPFVPQLETLRLDGTELADEGIDWLADCDRFTNLKHLSLLSNHISDRGARRIARTGWFDRLESLDLRNNGDPLFGDEPILQETADFLRDWLGERIKVDFHARP
jgi:uncharacterized protein (TIGR02996 family)